MTQGKFFWYDVMTSDTQAATDFYAKVVGWGVQQAGAPGMDYTVFSVNGQGVAGLMPIPDDMKGQARPCWMAYVSVDDVPHAVSRIEAAGGVIHRQPVLVPGIIHFAVVADPQGAVFLVAKGLSDEVMTEIPLGTPGTIGWRELYADDWQAAFAFYETLFGWTKAEAIDMGPMGQYQLFATGDAPVGGMMTKPPHVPVAHWGLYFNVEALDAAIERVTAAGGTILMGPHEVPGGDWVAQGLDPQGAAFGLTARKR